MKKILALLLVCLMCFALASCGDKNTDSTPDSATPDSAAVGQATSDSAAADAALKDAVSSGSDDAGQEKTNQEKSDTVKSDSEKTDTSKTDTAKSDSVTSGSGEAEAETPTLKPNGEKYKTVGDYLEDPKVKESLTAVNESLDDVISFTYFAEGNTLHYNYTYSKVYVEKALEELKKSHEELLKKNDDNNQKVVSVLRVNTEEEDPKLVVTYYNGDGAVITTRTYE